MKNIVGKIKDKYSESRRKTIIKNYYTKESYKGKTHRANYMDNTLMIVLLFISLTIFLVVKTDSILLPIYISAMAIFFISRFTKTLRNKKTKEKILKINEDLKSKRITRELSQLNREEFIDYTKAILEKYYQSEFIYGEDGIDLIGVINNKRYAVKCIKSSFEDKIIIKRATDFSGYINYLDYDEGIIITNSFFQEGIKENSSLILFDFSDIKEILKKIDEYPSDEEITNYIVHRYDDRKNTARNEIKLITFKKIIKLYLIFILFYIISFFVRFSIYYKIMGIIAFVIATALGGIKITEYYRLKGRFTLLK